MADSKNSWSRSFSTSSWGKWDFKKRKSYRSRLGFGGDVDYDVSTSKDSTSTKKSTSYSSGSYWGGDYYDGYGSYRYSYGGGGRYSNYAWKYSTSASDIEKEKRDLEFFKLAYQEARDLVNIIDFPFRVNIYMDKEGKKREGEFAGEYSGAGYRDIYVPGKVLTSKRDDREKLTIFSGIAIHEAAHLLFTDVDVLVKEFSVHESKIDTIDNASFRINTDSIVFKFLSKFIPVESNAFIALGNLALTLTGITEDERVEVALLEQRNGWGEYIDKQKDYYRSTYGCEVSKTVSSDKVKFRDFILTLVDMIRYPDHLNMDIVNLYKAQFEKVQEILSKNLNNTNDSIFRGLQLLKICILVASKDGKNFSDLEDLFNLIPDPKYLPENIFEDEELIKFLKDSLKSETLDSLGYSVSRANEVVGMIPSSSIPLSGRDKGRDLSFVYRSINGMDEWGEGKVLDSCRGVINLGSKNNVIFYRPKGNESAYRKVYKEVSGLTNTLRSFIQNMNKNYDFTIHGQRTGKLDTSKLAEAYQGVPQVYTKTGIVRTSGINICVVIDESGSMGGTRIQQAKQAAILLNEAFGKIPGVDLYIYGQSADEANYSYEETTDVYIYREPGNRFVNPNGYALSTVSAKCENRDGVAIREIAKRIRKITSQPVLMFILSDGNPSACNYRGREAVEHTAKMVKEIKDDGFYPIQITISNSCTASHEMFDTVVDLTSDLAELPKKLGGVIRKKIAEALQNNQTITQI